MRKLPNPLLSRLFLHPVHRIRARRPTPHRSLQNHSLPPPWRQLLHQQKHQALRQLTPQWRCLNLPNYSRPPQWLQLLHQLKHQALRRLR